MNLNTTVFRRHTRPIVVIFLFLTVLTITVYKYKNEGFYSLADDSSEAIERLTNILQNMVDNAVKNYTLKTGAEGKCKVPVLDDLNKFFDYGKREKYNCKNMVEIGGKITKRGMKDGSKFVCMESIVPGNCNVLSFGINNEWSFDDAMYEFGCTVYAFDPTMGIDDFDRTPGIHFFNLGLSDFKGEKMIGKRNCKVDRYENIIKMLNLTTKTIDYLKMDIERSEINFFVDVMKNSPKLLENVKQLGVEIHPGHAPSQAIFPNNKKNTFNLYWSIMHRLECHGFKLLHYEANRVPNNHYKYGNRNESACYEIVWIK